MVGKRTLPERRNTLLDPEHSPSHEELVDSRRLGQTSLQTAAGFAGLTAATKAENQGIFDYAHLKVPLPKDLSGSGVFTLRTATSYPEHYFLMRRSSDGYISSTGMFKATYPWASIEQEEAERVHHRKFPSAGPEEIAGSVWLAPEEALSLADEYGIRHWIVALLDPKPMEKGTKSQNANVRQPPKFSVEGSASKKTALPAVVLPPSSSLRATRARSSRSASPSKIATPSRKMASPRKPRAKRAIATPEPTNGEEVVETTKISSASLKVTDNSTTTTESVAESVVTSDNVDVEHKETDSVRIEVQETVEQNGDEEKTTTNVKIDVPLDHPELPTPEDPTQMIAEARKMVEEARELERGSASTSKSKRKAEELTKEDLFDGAEERPAKHARIYTTEQQYTKEKMTRRALVGLGFMAAIGTAFQYFT